jgi:phage baseplate assembly protein V
MNAEIERLLANLIRVGTVLELDEANARVKMKVGGLTTDWLPWGETRAGETRTWSAPRPGEQRLVFAPYGDTSQAIVGPAIYQDDHPAPATSKDKETTVFPDGTTFEYDSTSNTYTQTVAGSGNWVFNLKHATINAENDATVNTETATVNASTKVELATPLVHCTQNLVVDGTALVKQMITGQGGMAISGGSGASVSGNVSVTGGNVTADGIGLKTHHHTAQGATAPTTAAQA